MDISPKAISALVAPILVAGIMISLFVKLGIHCNHETRVSIRVYYHSQTVRLISYCYMSLYSEWHSSTEQYCV